MKLRIAIAAAFAIAGIALAGCPREQAPPREAEASTAPTAPVPPASIASPTSMTIPQANEPKPPQSGHRRAPPPEPDPLIPPPPVDK
jgi:hypothetical protein